MPCKCEWSKRASPAGRPDFDSTDSLKKNVREARRRSACPWPDGPRGTARYTQNPKARFGDQGIFTDIIFMGQAPNLRWTLEPRKRAL